MRYATSKSHSHYGSVRTIVNASGTVVERNDYYPFGSRTTFGASYATLASNRQKFSGKEDQTTVAGSTLPYLDFGARMYDAKLVRWNTYDPLAEKYYGINPYVYCNEDPVNLVDPEGKRTFVYYLGKGRYQVVGGRLDFDRYIYVMSSDNTYLLNENGKRITIGKSLTRYSFYNSDKREWAEGSIIDINDMSGANFISYLTGDLKSLGDYMEKAKVGGDYDFKHSKDDIYSGMPFLEGGNIIASARDIGNYVAGYYAGSNAFSWALSRIAFDFYQGGREGISTRKAQKKGWKDSKDSGLIHQMNELYKSVPSLYQFLSNNLFQHEE